EAIGGLVVLRCAIVADLDIRQITGMRALRVLEAVLGVVMVEVWTGGRERRFAARITLANGMDVDSVRSRLEPLRIQADADPVVLLSGRGGGYQPAVSPAQRSPGASGAARAARSCLTARKHTVLPPL